MFNLVEWLYLKQKNNLVYYDQLTGCKSKYYYDKVVKVKYNNKQVNVIFVDIDGLKSINDTHGHAEGSRCIATIGHVLLSIPNVKEVCRVGGDEFVLISDLSLKDCIGVKKCSVNIDELPVSIGEYRKEMFEDMSSAVTKADTNMYKVKELHHMKL